MSSKTTLIAKNTLMLYFRQILVMLVSLYTVRVKLEILGVEDYGIYNVVAGFVVMFSFINEAMGSATQRFLNFAMGQNDKEHVRNIFSASLIIHIAIAIFVIILAQTAGLWFFLNFLNIPPDRQSAAFIVYQLSIAVAAINIIRVPYRATIIAYQKMSFFAFLSICEALLKLAVVFLLKIILFDKLIVYSILFLGLSLIIFFVFKIYCYKMFETARFRYKKDRILFRELANFSAWSFLGEFSNLFRRNGLNVLINIFHGVVFNAAFTIATQVSSAVYTFVSNFQTAFRPQITKSYAVNDHDYFMKLIFQSSKISFFLFLVVALPVFLNTDFILQIWLQNVPEYTIIFFHLVLINSFSDALSTPLSIAILATGDIKKYQITVSCFRFANLPLSLLFLLLGFSPAIVLIIKIFLDFGILFSTVAFFGKNIKLPLIDYLHKVILPIILITALSVFFNIILSGFFFDWSRLIISCFLSLISIGLLVYSIGLNSQERLFIKNLIGKTLKRNVYN